MNYINNYQLSEKDIFAHMKSRIENLPQTKSDAKRKGINLRINKEDLERQTYLYFCNRAKRKILSENTLDWMNKYIQNDAKEDLKKNLHDQEWVSQIRKLRGIYK